MEKNSKVNQTTTHAVDETKTNDTVVDKSTTEVTETTNTKSNETPIVSLTPTENEWGLTHLDKNFVYELMSIPTYSAHEYRLLTFIVLWARRNKIKYEFDDYGNLYLTKGEIEEGEYYPCVTAHLDSVQTKHKTYAQAGQPLNVKTRTIANKHEIYVDGMGIGGDDKAGVLIGLSMFEHVDKLKACFFLEEETGCKGSNSMNVDWFNDVGYVLGYDSPDLNRAAYACSGVKLFSADFFKEHMQAICNKHGLFIFKSEPFTDVKVIREKTDIICMNFGSGYYGAHGPSEYCVVEDMDTACRMGHELIEHLGTKRYECKSKSMYGSWTRGANGVYTRPEDDEDEKFLRTLSGEKTYARSYNTPYQGGDWDDAYGYDDEWYYQGSGNRNVVNSGNTKSTTTTKTTTTSTTTSTSATKTDDKMVSIETVRYISEKYEQHVANIEEKIKSKCEALNVDFNEFKEIFENQITF